MVDYLCRRILRIGQATPKPPAPSGSPVLLERFERETRIASKTSSVILYNRRYGLLYIIIKNIFLMSNLIFNLNWKTRTKVSSDECRFARDGASQANRQHAVLFLLLLLLLLLVVLVFFFFIDAFTDSHFLCRACVPKQNISVRSLISRLC